MAKHLPSVVWPLRRDFKGGYVETRDKSHISLNFPIPHDPGYVQVVVLTRADARLWAKRINQCLEATK